MSLSQLPADHRPNTAIEVVTEQEEEARLRRALDALVDDSRNRARLASLGAAELTPPRAPASSRNAVRFARAESVPVVLLPRRAKSATKSVADIMLPTESAALAAERALREKAEQALRDSNSRNQTLQARLLHMELAHHDALAAERTARERAEERLCQLLQATGVKGRAVLSAKSRQSSRIAPTAIKPSTASPAQMAVAQAAPEQATSASQPVRARNATSPADRAAVLRLIQHGAITQAEACNRLNLKPRTLRDLLLAAKQHGIDKAVAVKPVKRDPNRPKVSRAAQQAERAKALAQLHAGKITREELCARLKIKPRCLRKYLTADAKGGANADAQSFAS